ncbi:hypothetical protein AAE478_003093 [Parahypoxylon ruwenzoriense]
MLRKSTLGALGATNAAFECAARRIAAPAAAQRSFSTTPQNASSLAHFTPTSSPELDELLSTIRHKIILPAYLPLEQRKRIFSPKYEKRLQSDPIIIEIDGEVLKFRHQNLFTDIPQTRGSVISAISQFQTPEDFANLRPLLEGIAYTGRKFTMGFYCSIIRIAGVKGHIFDVIECARGVAHTGFRLDVSEKVNEVLHFIQMKAVDADWEPAAAAQALRWAEMVIEMVESENHQLRRHKDEFPLKDELPLHRDPMTLLAPLHIAASLVARHGAEAGEGVAEKVESYAQDIVRLWPAGKKLTEVQPKELYEDVDRMGYLLDTNKFIVMATPLLHGLDAAIGVLKNPALAAELTARRDLLAAELQEARKASEESPKAERASAVYAKFYGEEA